MKTLIFRFAFILAIAFSSLMSSCTSSKMQAEEHYIEVLRHRKITDGEFSNPETSPLTQAGLQHFHGLEYFDIDNNYAINAKFVRTSDSKIFNMPTTTERSPEYRKYGEIHFQIGGKDCILHAYESIAHLDDEEHNDYLFVPFKDHTNGDSSYGGGRFIDVEIPKGDRITIDFNMSYNPYCAYNHAYSCPIPPRENHLEVAIPSGVKAPHDESH